MSPRYDYECSTCKTCIEISKSYKEVDKEELCETCQTPMTRMISKSAFALKGDGWHSTDYSKDNKKLKEEKA